MAIHSEAEDAYYDRERGQIARVAGLECLPQNVQQCLSLQRGEWFFSTDYGVRFGGYLQLFMDSPWIGRLLMLDVIRLASIPYHHRSSIQTRTPLHSIERVVSVQFWRIAGSPGGFLSSAYSTSKASGDGNAQSGFMSHRI
jgi:hypothetical protein